MGHSTRRNFLKTVGWGALSLSLEACRSAGKKNRRPNILLITADDMNYNSPGCYGSSIPRITPSIDSLAEEGMRFSNAHVNITVCQPCRQSLLTGRYAFRHGGEDFNPIWLEVPTLGEQLRAAGYWNGILGKEKHLKPDSKFCMDFVRGEKALASGMGIGRNPAKYKAFSREFFTQARTRGKPFFLMANAHDPHRPFAKANCYLNSTKTPWIVCWPGKVQVGSVNHKDFISGIDFMPTVLEIVGLPQIEGMDGRSFTPLLQGKSQSGRDSVFTEFHQTFAKNRYPMRCVQTAQFGYIFNFWPDGQTRMTMDSTGGLSFKAMQKAALKDREIESRVRLFSYRIPEEFYKGGVCLNLDDFEISIFIFSIPAVALIVLTVISSFLGMSRCRLWTMVKNL